jgi:hypothetical protein
VNKVILLKFLCEKEVNKMVKYSRFIKSEIEQVRDCGNLTSLQSRIFDVMLAGRLTREAAAAELGMSYSKFHEIEKELYEKIQKILSKNPSENQKIKP